MSWVALDQRFNIELKALYQNIKRRDRLGENIKKLALPNATHGEKMEALDVFYPDRMAR